MCTIEWTDTGCPEPTRYNKDDERKEKKEGETRNYTYWR